MVLVRFLNSSCRVGSYLVILWDGLDIVLSNDIDRSLLFTMLNVMLVAMVIVAQIRSKYFNIAPLALVALLISSFAVASGGYGGSGTTGTVRQTDPVYEHGKAIYKGRIKQYSTFSYCLIAEKPAALATDNNDSIADEPNIDTVSVVKIKSKTIKPYKGVSYQALADQLVNCDKPDQKAFGYLQKKDLVSLVYYLNKRYRLKLAEG